MNDNTRKRISFVVPFYNEGVNVDLFHRAITETTAVLPYALEFVYINDGSADDTFARLRAVQDADPRVTVVNFSRNFGHQKAITAGMDYASGDAVVIMDADLQDPPSVALELIARWEEGYDVAFAQRRTRKDSAIKKLTADAYYRLLEKIGDVKIPRNTGDFRLMDRRVVDEVKKYREHDRYMRGIVASIGFKQIAVPFDRDERLHGETHYPMSKMIKLAADGVLGFSTFPLTIMSRVGFLVSGISTAWIIEVILHKLFHPEDLVQGWSLTMIAILFMGGINMMMLGVLGSYIGRIYREAQDRPLYSLEGVYVTEQPTTHHRPSLVTTQHAGVQAGSALSSSPYTPISPASPRTACSPGSPASRGSAA